MFHRPALPPPSVNDLFEVKIICPFGVYLLIKDKNNNKNTENGEYLSHSVNGRKVLERVTLSNIF